MMMFPKNNCKHKNKNTKRNVTDSVKQEVYERDNGKCVCCGKNYPLERTPHHAWYGFEAIRDETRNKACQLVTICIECHNEIHFKGDPKNKREQCKDYLRNYYKQSID